MVEPSKILFLIQNTIPQKEDIILLYIGYNSIPKENTIHVGTMEKKMETTIVYLQIPQRPCATSSRVFQPIVHVIFHLILHYGNLDNPG